MAQSEVFNMFTENSGHIVQLQEELEEYFEAAGFTGFRKQALSKMNGQKIVELHEETFEQNK